MRLSPRRLVLVLAALVSGCYPENGGPEVPSQVLAPPSAEYAETVEQARTAALGQLAEGSFPGLSVAVGMDGEIVWAEGFGWADLGDETPVTPLTLFRVGSIATSFTAAAVGLLHDQGRLDLDASVQEYVPSFPEKRWPVTTRDLMAHVSGIRHFRGDEAMSAERCEDVTDGLEVFAEDSLLFEPGQRYRYSGYGWNLVSAAIQAVAEEPYLDFMEREVFAPLGMDRTAPDSADQINPERARPYDQRSFRTFRQSQHVDNSCEWASYGFLSTPADLVRFGFAMLDGDLLDPETVELLWTPVQLGNGRSNRNGLGWAVRSVRFDEDAPSSPLRTSGGRGIGGRATLMIFPDQRMVVAAATNVTGGDVSSIASDLGELFQPHASR